MNNQNSLPNGPLSQQTMKTQQETNGFIEGQVTVELKEITHRDHEQFLDLLSERLTGSDCLGGIDYTIIGHTKTAIILKVTGDACYIIDEE